MASIAEFILYGYTVQFRSTSSYLSKEITHFHPIHLTLVSPIQPFSHTNLAYSTALL